MFNQEVFKKLFLLELASRFSFRGRLITDVLLQALKLLVPLFTWYSLFQKQNTFGGYTFQEMLIYVTVLNFIGFVFSMNHGSELAALIKNGRLSALILRPFPVTREYFPKFVARVVFNFSLILGPILILFYAFDLLGAFQFSLYAVVLVFLNLVFCYYFGLLFGLSAFWLGEVWPLAHLIRALITVVGGVWFPLDLLPGNLGDFFEVTPFAHLGYLNAVALQNKLQAPELLKFIGMALLWITLAILLQKWLFRQGLKKYEAVGG